MQVEEGYECSGLQPSTCWPANSHPNNAATGIQLSAHHCDTMDACPNLQCCSIGLRLVALRFSLT